MLGTFKCNDPVYQGYHSALEPCIGTATVPSCDNPVYQGYHEPLAKCVVETSGSLPYTGANLLVWLAIAVLLAVAGYVMWREAK